MEILGIDFTSKPSRRKPITCVRCMFENERLVARRLETWGTYSEFEAELAKPGPWVAGLDFPFGQARRFIETIGWPLAWDGYVAHARSLGREGFLEALTLYRKHRASGDKEHRRATDEAAGSISPQKLYGVPVGKMFFEGAPRLLAAGVTIPHLLGGDPRRIAVEAYPGVLARSLVGRSSYKTYKTDNPKKQTEEQRQLRLRIAHCLRAEALERFGFTVETDLNLSDDPGADDLDALLCGVQAAWAWTQRDRRYGAPDCVDPLEGWIADPSLSSGSRRSTKMSLKN